MTTQPSILTTDRPPIIYPESDGMPLPDGEYQGKFFIEILSVLTAFFSDDPSVGVNGDTFIYYQEGAPNLRIAPDCRIVFGIGEEARESLRRHNTYLVWEVGKFPDFVMEIGSPSTASNDLGSKRELYARLGALEYWRYDPSGGEHYGEPLVGERLVDGEYRRIEPMDDPEGNLRIHSPLLNLELCWEEDRLRFYDPVADRWLENNVEALARADFAESRADFAESRADFAESRVESERAARLSAEARAARLEAEIRRLRGE